MRAILGLAGLALVLSASVAALAEVPLPPPRPEGIAEEAAATGEVPLPPVRPQGIENERLPVDGPAAIGPAVQPEGEDSAACIARLAKAGVRAEPAPAIENGACGVRHPLRLIGLPDGLEVSPPAIVTCAVAEALTKWAEGVSAEAERHLSGRPAKILIGTSYECRGQNRQAGAKLSEHAFANGVDVMGFAFRTAPDYRDRAAPGRRPRGAVPGGGAREGVRLFQHRARAGLGRGARQSPPSRHARAPSRLRHLPVAGGTPRRCSGFPTRRRRRRRGPRGSPCAYCRRP